jgi:glycosyltransferase involved in cell wall biosynthesis
MASSIHTSHGHLGLLIERPLAAVDAAAGATGAGATIAGLERLGLRARTYALYGGMQSGSAAQGDGLAREGFARWEARATLHLQRLATAPLHYLGALAGAALRGRAGWVEFDAAVQWADALRRDGVVHLHACDLACAALAASVARLTGLPFSISTPSFEPFTLDVSTSRQLRSSLVAAQFALLPSDAALRAAQSIAPGAKVHRAYPGVDPQRYGPKLRHRHASIPLLLAVGEARAPWDLEPFIVAMRRLAESGVVLRCEVVGAARDLPRLQSQIDRCGLRDRVRLTGPLSANRLEERYARAAIFVQVPSATAHEAAADIPAGLLEAMAMGLPVIAIRSPATEECVTHGHSGWLVTRGDAAQLFEAAQCMLVQPRLGENLGKQAHEVSVERFDRDVNLLTLQRLLEEALQRATRTSARRPVAERSAVTLSSAGLRLPTAPQRRGAPELHHA